MAETILCGDAREQLQTLAAGSVHTCVTSPPYYHLRDYSASGQIGMEQTPEEYIGRLVEVFREVRRVLRPDGTLWLNIGDSYQNKSLIGIPWMLALALRADGWYLRQDIIWHKPNALPESAKDRCTRSHEYIFLLSKSERYYFDSAAIREPCISKKPAGNKNGMMKGRIGGVDWSNPDASKSIPKCGKNKRDVWIVSTGCFKGAHFAVFPEKLVEPCILAGCPEGGTVLDPFAGSGTTGVVAKRLGRWFVGVEINPDYCQMATKRIAES